MVMFLEMVRFKHFIKDQDLISFNMHSFWDEIGCVALFVSKGQQVQFNLFRKRIVACL